MSAKRGERILGPLRASASVSRRVADLDEDQEPADLLWIPCAKTPAHAYAAPGSA
ncbi:MAG TPA: hypothetical protein VF469_06245 [Kofleriaceae bacterium]